MCRKQNWPNKRSKPMREAVIVDAVRTPGGKRNGKLQDWHAVDLAAHVLKAIEERNGLNPELIDDVIMGCVMQVGEQSLNIGRNAVLAAGWPESVPATTVDRQCGSSQQALHFAAQGVIAGAYDIVIAAGVEVMTRTPMGASVVKGMGFPFSDTMQGRYEETGLPPQGIGAEMIADEYGFTREDLDAFGAESQRRAAVATSEGRFENEIVPVPVVVDGETIMMARDEGIRDGTTSTTLGALKPAFKEDGKVTAGNSSQISDGASAVLVMSAEKAAELGLKPRARFHSFAVAGADPVTMLKGPIPATEKIIERSGLSIEDIDLFEVNEAFASVVLAWQKEHDTDLSRTNVNGGAIALGHPLGSSGTKLMATLLNELERTGGRYGLQTMCEGGGMANATIIERIES
jgi:acetyl-CoA acyltransferase